MTKTNAMGFAGLAQLTHELSGSGFTHPGIDGYFENVGPDTIQKFLESHGYAFSGEPGHWTIKEPGGALSHLATILDLRQYAKSVQQSVGLDD